MPQPDRDTAFTAWVTGSLPLGTLAFSGGIAEEAFAAGWDAERQHIAAGVREHMDDCPGGCVDLGWLDDLLHGAINGADLLGGDHD